MIGDSAPLASLRCSRCSLGLAVGKAWERYKLRDGKWIDRRRPRESPHYMLGLNFLVANQIDLGDRGADPGRAASTATRSRCR